MKKYLIIFILTIFSSSHYALEIDEKLTSRFLKVSNSRKTVLINRGLEDGLVVGDHAKFFLTTGVIARGVVVKASPTRSIWAVYRVVQPDTIYPDRVVNIKIAKPLKLTDDPTKSFKDQGMQPGSETMTLVRGDQNMLRAREQELSDDERQDIASMGAIPMGSRLYEEEMGLHRGKTLEIFGLLHFNSLSSSIDQGDNGTFTGQMAKMDFSAGLEKYFESGGGFLRNLSLSLFFHSGNNTTTSVQGQQLQSSIFEYGLGASYHFMSPALSYNRVIGFVNGGFGIGSVKDTVSVESSSVSAEETLNGSSNFLSLGFGFKYYSKSGFGGRTFIDYYRRSESYNFEETDQTYTKISAGPRVQFGLSYRW